MDNRLSELHTAAKKTPTARLRTRFLAVAFVLEGNTRYQAASVYKVSRRLVNQWVTAYLAIGLQGLMPPAKENRGAKTKLTPKQQEMLIKWIDKQALSERGGRLTGKDIQNYIQRHFGVSFHLNHIYKLLKNLGFSWISSRSKHPKQSLKAQEEFKKTSR